MCFSATASFVASGALTGMGVATYAVARKKDRILVAIPILFGIQQFFEGVQWLYLNRGESSLVAGYGFLFFALVVWPVYVPAFVRMLDKKRKATLRLLLVAGMLVAAYFIVILATQPLRIRERANCVNYSFDLPGQWIVLALYLLAILGPLVLSSRPIFRWFGLVVFLAAAIAGAFHYRNFISVWCFFAAIVSALFFLYVQRRRSMRLKRAE